MLAAAAATAADGTNRKQDVNTKQEPLPRLICTGKVGIHSLTSLMKFHRHLACLFLSAFVVVHFAILYVQLIRDKIQSAC